ncbi:unnamed protein product [Cyprideis torosa]|uniref:Uncharacterized protein n=1 Tax=Cyprideis torosa TaxID=163714 RepID=A0A7R8W5I6_9CRUS|nr:unnamed protein product [Cyprideis torosa]CAG0880442.1 unnamed protein product [Cyprideis torosa]
MWIFSGQTKMSGGFLFLVAIVGASAQYDSDYDPMFSRVAPKLDSDYNQEYILTSQRLEEIREPLLYPFYDGWYGGETDAPGENDYQSNFNEANQILNKHLNILLPFYGFAFNYSWISLNGYVGFSDHLSTINGYPLQFPTPTWPEDNDPSFIGPFFSECRIGKLRGDEHDQRKPGVYYRVERDLQARKDQFGVELRERVKWDIREGMVGSVSFSPKHVFIVTWKNVTFNGGQRPWAQHVTNTFQLVVATDEVLSYAIFNYEWLGWTTHVSAGGSSDQGQGGTPAFVSLRKMLHWYFSWKRLHLTFPDLLPLKMYTEISFYIPCFQSDIFFSSLPYTQVGFNAGNGTRAFEYLPYSQLTTIRDLPSTGYVNGKPGRHMFRIDERIYSASCNPDPQGTDLPLVFAPESGNMLGGTLINVTGPCFTKGQRVICQFEDWSTEGVVLDQNIAQCIQPRIELSGYVTIAISVDNGPYYWKGKYFVETPAQSQEKVWFPDGEFPEIMPESMRIQWDWKNLTQNPSAGVQISVWGYRESRIQPQFLFIDMLEEGIPNSGETILNPPDYSDRRNDHLLDLVFGFIMVNLTNPFGELGLQNTPVSSLSPVQRVLWSAPIPLAWYFSPQWERKYRDEYDGDWASGMCDEWIEADRALKLFAYEVPKCPCLIEQAVASKGYYTPDFTCDKDGNTECRYHTGATHCIRTGMPNKDAAGQQCCYDRDGYLMMSTDSMWGGNPHRAHNWGMIPYNEANKVPTLSHWYHDVAPFYVCCKWQIEQSDGCQTFRFERRASQDCVGYQPPGSAAVFGDPHIYTFDDVEYTFNGMGEFVLVRANTDSNKLDVQGRFEPIDPDLLGLRRGTHLTSVAARDNQSATVEVRLRPPEAQWRYHLDIIVDQKYYYFDRYPQKIQIFKGVTVYTPSNVLNQSHVVFMFQSGAGVEVIENKGFLSCRVYLPMTYVNQTRGLFGNWSYNPDDDFQLPTHDPEDYLSFGDPLNEMRSIFHEYGMKWAVEDKEDPNKGKTLFLHENGKSSNFFYDNVFEPDFDEFPEIPTNVSLKPDQVIAFCGESYQCMYDYAVTMNREFAKWSKHYQDEFVNIKKYGLRPVTSCGALPTPQNGRKSSFWFTVGTEVKFDCDTGYVLTGEKRRWCYASGEWNWPEEGEAECIPEDVFYRRQAGITSGIVLVCVIPVLFLLVCMVMRIRKRQHRGELEEEKPISLNTYDGPPKKQPAGSSGESGYPSSLSHATGSLEREKRRSRRRSTLHPDDVFDDSPASSATSKSGKSYGLPTMMEGVYRTGEPLPHSRNASFPSYLREE